MKALSEEIYDEPSYQRKEHNFERYIQWVTTLSLYSFVWLLLPPKSAKSHEILQKL